MFSSFLSSTALTGVRHAIMQERLHCERAKEVAKAAKPATCAPPAVRLHRTTSRERKFRDRGFPHETRVVERDECGEVPD